MQHQFSLPSFTLLEEHSHNKSGRQGLTRDRNSNKM